MGFLVICDRSNWHLPEFVYSYRSLKLFAPYRQLPQLPPLMMPQTRTMAKKRGIVKMFTKNITDWISDKNVTKKADTLAE